jgi:sugar lactone lactonase YvrE
MNRYLVVIPFATIGCTGADSTTEPPDIAPDAAAQRAPFTLGVSTLAGWADAGDTDGSRDVNLFHNPVNVALAPDGMLYVADFDNDKIRAVDPTGTATTVIAIPQLTRPFGMTFVGSTLFVQTDNDPDRGHSSTTGTLWEVDVGARAARWMVRGIGRPRGLAALQDGRIGLADYVHHVIQIFDPVDGSIAPLAGEWDVAGDGDGSGVAAHFANPYGLVQRADGALVVTDFGNHRLRVVGLDGTVTTLTGSGAGSADGALADARFDHPQAIAIDGAGVLYVSDLGSFRVRRIWNDRVDTVAGTGTGGYADSDDPLAASFFGLEGLAVDPTGSTLFVADGTRGEDVPHNRVRSVRLAR